MRIEFPSSSLPAAGRVDSLRLLSRVAGVAVVLLLLALWVVPWQQSVQGTGRVVAYAPLDRQQTIEAPIDGRVVNWHVQEGDVVKKGDPIADLADNDVDILLRIRRELDAAQTQVDAAGLSVTLTESRVLSMQAARDSAVANAKLRTLMANDRRDAAQRALDAAKARVRTAALNLERTKKLEAKGLASRRDLELAQLESEVAETELGRAEAALRAAKAEAKANVAEQGVVAATHRGNIESTQAALEKLRADRAKAEGELARVENRLARQEQMRVFAPRAGTVFRLLARDGTEMVKAGDPLLVLVPDTDSRAVELFVSGLDAPLVTPGTIVRVQFEGWPAIQFVGWPSVAVGTFPARVAFVDSHDDGHGRFRVMVVPENSEDWPDVRFLRQGVRANGWFLLNRVRLGFELWRQLNAFPPALPGPADVPSPAAAKKTDAPD